MSPYTDFNNDGARSVILTAVSNANGGEAALFCAVLSAAKELIALRPFTSFRATARRSSRTASRVSEGAGADFRVREALRPG